MLMGTVALLGMLSPKSQSLHVLMGAEAWLHPASSHPKSQLLQVSSGVLSGESCSPDWHGLSPPPVFHGKLDIFVVLQRQLQIMPTQSVPSGFLTLWWVIWPSQL